MNENNRVLKGRGKFGLQAVAHLRRAYAHNTLSRIPSPRTDLNFRQFAIYYEAYGIKTKKH